MNKNRLFFLGILVIAALFAANTVSADTETTNPAPLDAQKHMGGPRGGMQGSRPAAMGKVTAVNGNTITIESRVFSKQKTTDIKTTPATATYTIDASNAKIAKAGATITVSDIAVGDNIMVQGTLTGTNVVATNIFDGMRMGPRGGNGDKASPMSAVSGDGQPVVAGSVTGINGSTITISNTSNVSYTIDASNAKIVKKQATSTISDIATGDRIVVQGAFSGTHVTATSVIDQGAAPQAGSNGSAPVQKGFFGAIKGFFGKLFGF